ncbi:MAG: MDR/zinc-dependent alcohol dehydrogenase-like family protein [Candidatus Cyclobacteriaceae bacterium M2_1C_046]
MELISEIKSTTKNSTAQNTGKTAILTEPKHFDFEEIELAKPTGSEILVKLEGCGICASNIPVWEGREWFSYPLKSGNPGHEGWGVVQEAGPKVEGLKVGDRVALLNDQAYSTHVVCDASSAVKIPASLNNVPFPGEPLGCAMNIFNRSDIREGQVVVILGIGFLGATLIQLAKQKNAHVIAVSRRESSRELAETSGVDAVFSWEEKDRLHQYINDFGKGCQRVIECVGKQRALDLATEIIGERGKLIVAGYHQEDMRHINMQIWNWKGIDVINAHERDPEMYKSGMRLAAGAIEEDKIEVSSLLTHKFPFEKLNEAMETLCNYPDGFTKAYITFE